MKTFFLTVIVLFSMSCKSQNTKSDNAAKSNFHQELKKKFIEGPSLEDCKEEISQLENKYLSKLKELEGYSWDKGRFTARVEISENKRLYVSLRPSGNDCDFVLGSATFVLPRDFSFVENKNEITDDFLRISELLCNEDDYEVVEQVLEEKRNINFNNNENDTSISLFPDLNKKEEELDINNVLKSFMAIFQKELDSNRYTINYLFP